MKTVIARYEAISELCINHMHWRNIQRRDYFVPCNDARVKAFVVTFFLLVIFSSVALAQSTYDNAVFRHEIKSVEFYNTSKKASFPIITLGSTEKVLLTFDNLVGGT